MVLLRDRLTTYLERIDREGNPRAALESLERVLLSRLPSQIGRLREAIATQGVERQDLPPALVGRMLAATGQARVQVFPSEDLQDRDALERFVTALRGVDPMTSGVSINLFDFGRATVASFERALALAVLLISALLWILWRSLREVSLALAPLLLSSILTLAAMAAFGIDFNFANVIVLPLLLGIGIDSGIHLVHRCKAAAVPNGATARDDHGPRGLLQRAHHARQLRNPRLLCAPGRREPGRCADRGNAADGRLQPDRAAGPDRLARLPRAPAIRGLIAR